MKSNTNANQTIYFQNVANEDGPNPNTFVVTPEWQRILGIANDWRFGAVDGVSDQSLDILLWGAQVEDGDSAPYLHTSYIPTPKASTTRAFDLCYIDGDNFSSWYNGNSGTILLEGELTNNEKDSPIEQQFVNFQTNGNNRFKISMSGSNVLMDSVSGGATQLKYTFSIPRKKMCLTYSTEGNAAADGEVETAQTGKSLPVAVANGCYIGDQLNAQNPSTAVSSAFFLKLTYYPNKMPDDVLEALTTQQT